MGTTVLHPGVDAAYPGAPLPLGTQVLAAYIGEPGAGGPDTPHIWTADEWNSYYERDPKLKFLPIYTHDYADGNPGADARNAVDAARALGWAPDMPGAQRRIILIDCETFVDPGYFSEVQAGVNAGGFRPALYGSASFVVQNPCPTGYVPADWNYAHQPTALPRGWLGIQWRAGTQWDLDVYGEEAYAACGVGPRRS
jgi:hypothetical protein